MKNFGRKSTKGKRAGGKARNRENPQTGLFPGQPVPDSIVTVPCDLCGHPVDPKRLHFHMVRFHGAALRSKGFQA
jgi:hypothetical protein